MEVTIMTNLTQAQQVTATTSTLNNEFSLAKVANLTGLTNQQVGPILNKLAKEGKLVKVSKGIYTNLTIITKEETMKTSMKSLISKATTVQAAVSEALDTQAPWDVSTPIREMLPVGGQSGTCTTDDTIVTPLNTNALSSTIAAKVFLMLNDAKQAILLACSVVDAITTIKTLGDDEMFLPLTLAAAKVARLSTTHIEAGPLTKELARIKLEYKENDKYYIATKAETDAVRDEKGTFTTTEYDIELSEEVITSTLGKLKMLNRDGTMGDVLIEMLEQRKEAYAPIEVGKEFIRKFPLMGLEKNQLNRASGLAKECILAQEASQATVSDFILDLANKVQPILDDLNMKDDEAYVLAGCNKLDSSKAYTSEFKFDNRLRTYQAACHGYNGQSSDRSRALMDLAGVPTDYNIGKVGRAIKAEMMDMIDGSADIESLIKEAVTNPVDFIVAQLKQLKGARPVKKVWSFVKAANLIVQLREGKRPYVGMAVGLDAKCSGPQYGALMAGDAELAAACGFTVDTLLADAYKRCVAQLDKAGLTGFSRNGIKKSFMAVYYGQGYAAFMDTAQLRKDEQFEVVKVLSDENGNVSEEVAKLFHKMVTKSFGSKLVYIRTQTLKFMKNTEGRFGHYMPDGAKVQMNYKVKMNIHNQVIDFDTVCPDVQVCTETQDYKFINLALKTKQVDADNFIRTSFVNMTQAVDALIARLIIVHLSRMGAKHIVAVHDCFRVNVTEMHLLEEAIKLAYKDLFGSKYNKPTVDLPMGTDILGMFFEGLEEAKVGDVKIVHCSQFVKVGSSSIRKFQVCNGEKLVDLIDKLGETYYFAK